MHVEIYPAFFTPRDEEPSLSSSEEKSSEFDWLESKITRKQKYESRASALYFTSLQNCTKDASLRTSSQITSMIDIWSISLCKGNYKAIYKGLFTIFPNLITKESYNWWVTRRVWGFRHQISKAKYLQMSVANIWKLQEEHRDAVQKYLRNSPGKRYQMIRICVTGEVETLSSPIRRQNSECETSGWNGGAVEFRMWYIRVEWRRQQNSGCDTSGVESGGNRM